MRIFRVTELVWRAPEDRNDLPWRETIEIRVSGGDPDDHIRSILLEEYGFEVVSFDKERITRATQAADQARWLDGDTYDLHRVGKLVQ
jgi:hypothetical protein